MDEERASATGRHFLTGLWLPGLHLGEALELYWDRYDKLTVDMSGRQPMCRILAAFEKGNRDRGANDDTGLRRVPERHARRTPDRPHLSADRSP